jgi:hypothetical protein
MGAGIVDDFAPAARRPSSAQARAEIRCGDDLEMHRTSDEQSLLITLDLNPPLMAMLDDAVYIDHN